MACRTAPMRDPCADASAFPSAILRLGVLKTAVNQTSGTSLTWTLPVSSRWTTSQPLGVFTGPMMPRASRSLHAPIHRQLSL
jgi:hypothetical protein